MNISREQYLAEKLKIDGECECSEDIELCGYCWYNGVRCWNPPECSACLDDTRRCVEQLNKASNGSKIVMKTKCCKWCCWFDWFHEKRVSLCKSKLVRLEYEH